MRSVKCVKGGATGASLGLVAGLLTVILAPGCAYIGVAAAIAIAGASDGDGGDSGVVGIEPAVVENTLSTFSNELEVLGGGRHVPTPEAELLKAYAEDLIALIRVHPI